MSLARVEWDFSGEKSISPDALPNFLRHVNEGRVATHDGYVWPVCRKLMAQPEHIVARMAEDLAAEYRAYSTLTPRGQAAHRSTFNALWMQDQLFDHYEAALRRALDTIQRGATA
jgi:hypothetical protein